MAQVDQHTCVSDWKKQFNWEIIPVQLHTACLLVQVGIIKIIKIMSKLCKFKAQWPT